MDKDEVITTLRAWVGIDKAHIYAVKVPRQQNSGFAYSLEGRLRIWQQQEEAWTLSLTA